jgi:hypothetical protein
MSLGSIIKIVKLLISFCIVNVNTMYEMFVYNSLKVLSNKTVDTYVVKIE